MTGRLRALWGWVNEMVFTAPYRSGYHDGRVSISRDMTSALNDRDETIANLRQRLRAREKDVKALLERNR